MGVTVGRAALWFVLLCAFFLATPMAQSQPDASQPDKPESGKPDNELARTHFLEGEKHYAAGRYELAVQEFESALKLSGKVELHFNLANCHERAGNYAAAASSLERFLASANAPQPEILRERIWRLKGRESERNAEIEKLLEERIEVEAAKTTPTDTTDRANPSGATLTGGAVPSQTPATIAIVAGGTGIVASLIFAGLARSAGIEAVEGCVDRICTQASKGALDKERRFALAADMTGLVSLAAVGLGGYLWYQTRRDRQALRVVPVANIETVGVSLAAEF